MVWYAFKGYNNGKAVNASTFDSTELRMLGFHGYGTEAQAESHPNSVPGFPNPLAAIAIPVVNAAIDDANNARDVASAPGNAAKALTGTGSIDDLINFVKQGGIWTRVAEVGVGGILLYVGLKALTTPKGITIASQSPGQVARNTKTAWKKPFFG